ncbi:hypothetical protein ACVXHA_13065 [Escherichia coli]
MSVMHRYSEKQGLNKSFITTGYLRVAFFIAAIRMVSSVTVGRLKPGDEYETENG